MIGNITDQLHLYVSDVSGEVLDLINTDGFDSDKALKIVALAIKAMEVEERYQARKRQEA